MKILKEALKIYKDYLDDRKIIKKKNVNWLDDREWFQTTCESGRFLNH